MDSSLLFQLLSLVLFSALVLLVYLKKSHSKRSQQFQKLPPGPPQLPIIGNLHQLGSAPHHSFRSLAVKHGPLMYLKLGSVPAVVVSSGEVAREIFKTHDLTFSGRPSQYAVKKISYGLKDVVFAPYGEYWRQVRKVSIVELLSPKRVQSYRNVREEEVVYLVSSIKKLSTSGQPINLSEATLALSNNIVCRGIFGDKCEGSSSNDSSRSRFHGILHVAQELLGGFCIVDFFPQLEWVAKLTGLEAKLEKTFRELDDFYNEVIEEHIKFPSQDCDDLVHVLLQLRSDPNYKDIFDDMDHIKGLLTDMFIAGTDTSSATLVWTMAELVRNPQVMAQVQEEVRRVIGENQSKVEERQLQELNYMKLVIKEAMRMHPPAPLLVPRETTEKCTVKGYVIPEKTRVFINAQVIGMDPQVWEDPHKFCPERFVGKDIDFRGQHFDLIPFGAGRRICPGINFGIAVVELALANLLFCFNWELPMGMRPQDIDMEESFGITMHKKNPLCLIATPY